jgi:hypothetical protein
MNVASVKRLWLYRYALLSITLALADFLIIFGGTGAWSCAPPPVPHSEPYRRLVYTHLGLFSVSVGLAGVALAREQPKKFAFTAVAVSLCSFFLCTMRMAL